MNEFISSCPVTKSILDESCFIFDRCILMSLEEAADWFKQHYLPICEIVSDSGTTFFIKFLNSIYNVEILAYAPYTFKAQFTKKASSIKSIEFSEDKIPMVDIEVEDSHDFYANNILVHNCVGTAKFKGGLRKAFVCPDDSYVWVTADYSQEELRLAGIFSGEPNIIEPIKQGKDLHLYIAEKMFGFADPGHRTRVKVLNFSVLYGAQKFTIARKLGCAVDEAQKLLDHYFKTMWHLDAWIKECHKQGRRLLMCFTYFGRPRLLGKYYNSSDKGLWGFADRTTVSHLSQGCAPIDIYIETSDGVEFFSDSLGKRLVQPDYESPLRGSLWRRVLYGFARFLRL